MSAICAARRETDQVRIAQSSVLRAQMVRWRALAFGGHPGRDSARARLRNSAELTPPVHRLNALENDEASRNPSKKATSLVLTTGSARYFFARL